MPVALSQFETEPVEPLIGPTLRCFEFGARQRPSGQLSMSAGMNTIVDHYLSLASLRHARLWTLRYLANRKAIRLHVDWRRLSHELRGRSAAAAEQMARAVERDANRPLMDASLEAAGRMIPRLRDVRIRRYWAGVIDTSPDGHPILDGSTGLDGLVVVTGLSGHGLALGPAIGRIAAELATEGRTDRSIDAFSLRRFEGDTRIPKKMLSRASRAWTRAAAPRSRLASPGGRSSRWPGPARRARRCAPRRPAARPWRRDRVAVRGSC
jgi:glycine/D-amino acid oxidase-like deaminating enzyme